MAYSLYTKNESGEIVAVTPGIDERVSNLETKAVETDLYKLDVREQTLTEEQKAQIVQNLIGTFLPLNGGSLSGDILFTSDNSEFSIVGGSSGGARIALSGKDRDGEFAGSFVLQASSDLGSKDLIGKPDGSLNWDGKVVDVVVKTDGVTYFRFSSGIQVCLTNFGMGRGQNNIVITLPAPFLDASYKTILQPTWRGTNIPVVGIDDSMTTTSNLSVWRGNINSGDILGVQAISIGRWK